MKLYLFKVAKSDVCIRPPFANSVTYVATVDSCREREDLQLEVN